MSTTHPNNAPDTLPPDASDETTLIAVLSNDALDQAPGGGAMLGTLDSRDALSSTPMAGGPAPNPPMTVPTPRDASGTRAPHEPHPTSR